MRKLIPILLLLALASPAFAGTKACTAAMVTAGICRDATNVVLYFDAPLAFWQNMATAICAQQGYQAEIDGAQNPQTCNEFAQAWLRNVLIVIEKSNRANDAANAARDAVLAEPDPDVGDGG